MDVRPYRPDPTWKNRAPVREPDHERSRWTWTLLCGIFAALAPLAFYVVQHNRYLEAGYRLTAVRDGLDAISEEERHLRVECTALETPPRVERAAAKLGLHRPSTDSLVMIQVGSPALGNLMARAPDARDPQPR